MEEKEKLHHLKRRKRQSRKQKIDETLLTEFSQEKITFLLPVENLCIKVIFSPSNNLVPSIKKNQNFPKSAEFFR
jgi:hypothetical protein